MYKLVMMKFRDVAMPLISRTVIPVTIPSSLGRFSSLCAVFMSPFKKCVKALMEASLDALEGATKRRDLSAPRLSFR